MANTFTTAAGPVNVLGGTLNLAKNSTRDTAILGALTIGDNDGAANSDRVVIANYDQIGNLAVTANRSGQLSVSVAPTSEVQRLTFSAVPDVATTFTLTFAGQVTTAIPIDASPAVTAASIQSALAALQGGLAGGTDVSVSAVNAQNFNISFGGVLAGANLPQIVAASSLTAGGAPVTIAPSTITHGAGNEVQTVTLGSGGLSGSFQVNFGQLDNHRRPRGDGSRSAGSGVG